MHTVTGMEYNFNEIERKWQQNWLSNHLYRVENNSTKPPFYVLDMFPYPSGAGLHVGHPLGYIACDIFSRYKKLKGFNVLHPMGFDSFGLPAEQYALETGRHPAETTKKNIDTFKRQLNRIGFCYDWEREVQTSNPDYYRWTQWLFLKLYNSYFCNTRQKARPITELIEKYRTHGSVPENSKAAEEKHFTADEWNNMTEAEQEDILMHKRLVYSSYGEVNWCEGLGTVLANDEVINGVSERGGFPVEKKKMRQWFLRITAYANRLLEGLEHLEFSDSMKEMQRNWIGKSEGAEVEFSVLGAGVDIKVYTTRPETIFGVDFMVLAPEHELVCKIVTDDQKESVDKYISYVKSRSDRERMSEVKQVTGCFTGAYAVNPFNGKQVPVYIAEYVLAGYGTGAIMAVPSGDQRDFLFARHFNIPITNIMGEAFTEEEACDDKSVVLHNSDFLNGLIMDKAFEVAINKLEDLGIGKKKVNYKMRDAGFSRQRYWGEPFPIIWKNGVPHATPESELPVKLPHVERYEPGPNGEGPLANVHDWINLPGGLRRESSTMPGYAGSSWYFLRYMDPKNDREFCSRSASDYWGQVDVYVGGTEHAVGHLLYSRMWTKVMYDLNLIGFDEPFKKLVNQGMIQGSSRMVYRLNLQSAELLMKKIVSNLRDLHIEFNRRLYDWNFDYYFPEKNLAIDITKNTIIRQRVKDFNLIRERENLSIKVLFITEIELFEKMRAGKDFCFQWISQLIEAEEEYHSPTSDKGDFFVSKGFIESGDLENVDVLRVDVSLVDGVELDIHRFREWRAEYQFAEFILENGKYICGTEVEKMSKSKYNTVNPDVLCERYGADTFRMYEMFLGPVEASKPWDTKGIEGVHRFLKKLWRIFQDQDKCLVTSDEPSEQEWRILHKAIKKIDQDTGNFSFNTAVSAFMVCVNELVEIKCNKRKILEPLLIMLAPYAPHISEELWSLCGNTHSVLLANYPVAEERYLTESDKDYPVSVNGKMRTNIKISLSATQEEVEKIVLDNEVIKKWLTDKTPKKIIFVQGKMINIVV